MSKKKSSILRLEQRVQSSDPMAQLLAKSGKELPSLQIGETVEGTVLEIGPKVLVLDIGAKAEGLVSDREFDQASSFIKKLVKGDKVTVTVVVPESKGGQALLSLRETAESESWKTLEEGLKANLPIDVKVGNFGRGGLTVMYDGIVGFIPTSQLGSALSKNPQSAIGKSLKVKVVEVDRKNNRVIFSERAVSESELIKAQDDMLKSIQSGEIFKGKVIGLVSFGAFVQIKKDEISLEGLVHLSEISWKKVEDPSSVLKEGDEVEVKMIGKEGGRLALSIKQTEEDPWEKLVDKYKPETKIKGNVTKTGEFGALVELEPGVEGLLRSSKIPAGISVKEGDVVNCFVEEIDIKNHKIGLGLVLKTKPIGYK